jgi:glycosyltransferase involved in cell wall biosynthesis
MRILQVTGDWKWTGPAEPMLHAVRGLRERGHRVELACPAAPEGAAPGALAERARARGFLPILELRRGQGFAPWRDGGEVRRLRELVRREGIEIVHAHHARDHLLARAAIRGTGAKLVASWHRGEPLSRWPWTRALYGARGCDGLVVLSEAIAASAREELGGSAERVAVVPGCVDAERFAPRAARPRTRESLGLKPEHVAIGCVARLQPHRRFDLLLEAFACARAAAPELRLVVVGRGTRARQLLEEPVRRLALGDSVIRAGYRNEDYPEVLACLRAVVFLVPGSDGSCRAVLEAMAMSIPAIASRRGVLPELVEQEHSGRLVDESPAALAAALEDVARSPGRWHRFGVHARERILARHTLEHQAAALEAFYGGLLRLVQPDAESLS